ncbi:MAG: polymer-forming cytoskeletal protein [Bacteroidales bacterium]|nr:polymer-forming cytoskeletal protein [Bacteroidales bacterium]
MESINMNEVSRISAGTVVKGELCSPTDIRIDGSFEGKIISKGRVVVGEKADITGDVICNSAEFSGVMKGNFFVKDTLTLKGGCSVDGDLHIKRLQVELDAMFNGNCRMISDAEFDRLTGEAAPEA